jgi:phosphotriesterase-related protein
MTSLDAATIRKERARRRGRIQTVLGLIEPSDLGLTLMHEHLLLDETCLAHPPADPEERRLYNLPLSSPGMLTKVRYEGFWNRDDLIYDDIELMLAEVAPFKAAGGSGIVEVTPHGLLRQPKGLKQIAERSGLNVIMGSSWYVADSHPADMTKRSEESLTVEIISDLFSGVEGTGICAGLIGEAGCSWPLTANERKVVRASAKAQTLSGACLMIHPGRDEEAPIEIVDVVREAGGDLSRTIICHIERTIFTKRTMKALAETGVILEFDLFGHEYSYYSSNPKVAMPNDRTRLDWLRFLIDEGHGDRIVISHDNDNKHHLEAYGGCGFAHIPRNIVPAMRRLGFAEADIRTITVETPRRLLTFV